jgi:N-acetylglucosaminyl-diphospho-decaprenol L-rhamnosyltransferase
MSPSRFSVVVVIHNSERHLHRLVDSIEEHLAERPELIVIDSGSRDSGANIARDRGALVRELEGNPGYGAANNVGVGLATCDVCVLLNPDVILVDDGLSRLVDVARSNNELVVPRLRNVSGAHERSAHPLPGTLEALLPALVHPRLLPRPLRLRAEPYRADRPRRVGWAIGACVAARTELLRAFGPFDARAFLFYEDMDLCLRARQAGVPTELRPEVELVHTGAHSTGPAFGGEPYELLARRRREVLETTLGPRARALDDVAQALTFATRLVARRTIRRDARRERAQLRALIHAREEQMR